jgi:integrase/recombinase XerD
MPGTEPHNRKKVNPIPDLKRDTGRWQVGKLIDAATNPRDKAFVALLAKTGMRISEVTPLKVTDIDFKRGILTIVHLKERVKLKCPTCGDLLGKRHLFCPGCGNKVSRAVREQVQQHRQRMIPVDRETLRLLDEYLKWRRQFPYRGPLVFPLSRQRGWQLIEKLGRRAGISGLHPHSFRRALATTWVSKGLDTKKLQILLGHASIATTMAYVDTNFQQLESEYMKLWEDKEDGKHESKGKETAHYSENR